MTCTVATARHTRPTDVTVLPIPFDAVRMKRPTLWDRHGPTVWRLARFAGVEAIRIGIRIVIDHFLRNRRTALRARTA